MSILKRAGLALACGTLLFGAVPVCLAVGKHCPPPYVHCQEKGPRIKFKCGCPRPVCPPCDSPWFGYYPTCWSPWGAGSPNCPSQNPAWIPGAHTSAQNVPPTPHFAGTPNPLPSVAPETLETMPVPMIQPNPVVPGGPRLDSDGRPGPETRVPLPRTPATNAPTRPSVIEIAPAPSPVNRPRVIPIPGGGVPYSNR